VNVVLGRFGLRSEAHRHTVVAFAMSVLVFLGVVVLTAYQVWHTVDTAMFQWLNGCVDSDSSLGWLQEQPYQPSAQYMACVTGVHRTAIIEASLAVGLLIAAAVAVLVWMVEEFADDHVVRADGLPAFSHKYRVVRRGCGIVAILLVVAAVMLIFPMS
jgi:hypothetical protein